MQLKYICVVYGEGTANDWAYQKWFANDSVSNFSMKKALWLDIRVQVNSSHSLIWEWSILSNDPFVRR